MLCKWFTNKETIHESDFIRRLVNIHWYYIIHWLMIEWDCMYIYIYIMSRGGYIVLLLIDWYYWWCVHTLLCVFCFFFPSYWFALLLLLLHRLLFIRPYHQSCQQKLSAIFCLEMPTKTATLSVKACLFYLYVFPDTVSHTRRSPGRRRASALRNSLPKTNLSDPVTTMVTTGRVIVAIQDRCREANPYIGVWIWLPALIFKLFTFSKRHLFFFALASRHGTVGGERLIPIAKLISRLNAERD